MKKVVDKHTVAHLWANQLQDEARNSNDTFYFFKDRIYSYGSHFVIAKHVTNKKGEKAVLFGTRTYSNTTSKHQNVVGSACSHLKVIYCFNAGSTNEENLQSWENDARFYGERLLTARKPEKYISELKAIEYRVNIFIKFFGIKMPASLKKLLEVTNKEEYLKIEGKRLKAEQKAKEKQEKRQQQLRDVEILNFRKFETDSIYWRNDFDLLRFNANTRRIETSQRVEIPEVIGQKFYQHILETIKNGGCVNCGTKLLDYTVKEINKDFIQVGCHKIKFEEIIQLANSLNW